MKIVYTLIFILAISLVSAFSFTSWFISSPTIQSNPTNVTIDNFATTMQNNPIINDLPRTASIKLSIGNKSFLIERNEISNFRNQSTDLDISFPKRYIKQLSTTNYCSTLRKAISKKDYKTSLKILKIKLVWKYSGLIKYHRCFNF